MVYLEKIKSILSRVWSIFYGAIFCLGVFAISYTTFSLIQVQLVKVSGITLFDSQGNLLHSYFTPWPPLGLGVTVGLVAWYYLGKKSWLKKISPIVVLLFLPFFWIVGHMSHWTIDILEYSPERIAILKKVHGIKAEPCDALKIGDHRDKAIEFYGIAQLGTGGRESKSKSGKMIQSELYQLPFNAPLFSIHFNSKTLLIIEIDCFGGKWKKAKGADPDTVYGYIEE